MTTLLFLAFLILLYGIYKLGRKHGFKEARKLTNKSGDLFESLKDYNFLEKEKP
jgi:hypothetical protein